MDDALRASEEHFRQIAETVSHVVWVVDMQPQERVSFVSPAFECIWGRPCTDLYADARLWMRSIHPNDAPAVEHAFDHWLGDPDHSSFDVEYRILRPDGEVRWVLDRGRAQRDDKGQVLRVTGVAEDITARKRTERALAEKQAQLQAMFDHLGEGVALFALDGTPINANRTAIELHGFRDADDYVRLIPELPRLFDMGTPDGTKLAFRDTPLFRVMRGEPVQGLELTLHHTELGWRRLYRYSGALVRDDDGKPQFAVLTMTDITERKRDEQEILRLNSQLEARVRERTAELEDAVKELEAFSYSVSHDLRAPLRAMDGFSQAVLQDHGALLPDAGRRYLGIIRESAQKMGQLIDDLLAFSRISRQLPRKRAVDHGKLVHSALQQLAPLRQNRRIEVQVDPLEPGHGDPAMLQQVWVNLLSNALKYSRQRDPAVIHVGCEETPAGPEFFVRDNGTGFDMRYAHKLFGVFERLHRAEDYEGTGVGLAIVQRVVQRHGGQVRAESAPGQGATFYFTLGSETP